MAKAKPSSRRELLLNGAKATGVACLAGMALTAYVESARKAEAKALRPPGALPEGACRHDMQRLMPSAGLTGGHSLA